MENDPSTTRSSSSSPIKKAKVLSHPILYLRKHKATQGGALLGQRCSDALLPRLRHRVCDRHRLGEGPMTQIGGHTVGGGHGK